MLKLFTHQARFLDKNPDTAILCWEGGSGKSIGAATWLQLKNRDIDALLVCPKRILKKWKNVLDEWGTKATIVSKEEFKKLPIKRWSAIIIDEADEFASPLFTKNRSQLSEKLYNLIKQHPEVPILLLTATPIRSTPWNLHSLLCFAGNYVDWKKWREDFFYLQYPDSKQFRFLRRPAWMPKPDWRTRMRPILEKHADIVLLKDCVGDLPPATEEVIKVKCDKFPGTDEVEPRRRFVVEHLHEQQHKPAEILEIAKEYRKVLVVAYYVEQVEALARELAKDRPTYMVHGSVKDQEKILLEANEVDECFLVVQASLGAGFDADTFSCVVFASMSYAVRYLVQMKFRVRRIHNLHPVVYKYLIAGRCDKAVKNNVDLGKDFVPSEWL